jgi:hypothetical protein
MERPSNTTAFEVCMIRWSGLKNAYQAPSKASLPHKLEMLDWSMPPAFNASSSKGSLLLKHPH